MNMVKAEGSHRDLGEDSGCRREGAKESVRYLAMVCT